MKFRIYTIVTTVALVLFIGCQSDQSTEGGQAEKVETSYPIELKWKTGEVLQSPVSLVHDLVREAAYVVDQGTGPGTGFVIRVTKHGFSGKLLAEDLEAPYASYLYDDILYVSNGKELLILSPEERTILRRIMIPGAELLESILYWPEKELLLLLDPRAATIFWLDTNGRTGTWVKDDQLTNTEKMYLVGKQQLLLTTTEPGKLLSISSLDLEIKQRSYPLQDIQALAFPPFDNPMLLTQSSQLYELVGNTPQLLKDFSTDSVAYTNMEWIEEWRLLFLIGSNSKHVTAYKLPIR